MAQEPLFIENLDQLIDTFPPDSILSRTVFQANGFKTILFAFQPGQELSQHTASVPAVLHFLEGKAQTSFGQEQRAAGAGTWIYLPPNLPHSIHAEKKTLLLLTLLPNS